MKLDSKKTTTTIVRERVELTARDIRELLRVTHAIPETATVFVNIPGGGDWSNTSLDIDAETPIVVTWQTEETK